MNRLKRFFHNVPQVFLTYLLWIVTSIPVITIGASTTALFYVLMQLDRDVLDGTVPANFFKSFRMNLVMSTIFTIIYGALGALIAYAVSIGFAGQVSNAGVIKIIGIVAAVPYVLSLFYLFGVQARFTNPVLRQMLNAFFMALKNFAGFIVMAAGAAISVLFFVGFSDVWPPVVPAVIIAVIILPGLMYLAACYYNDAFVPYLPESLMTEEEKAKYGETPEPEDAAAVEQTPDTDGEAETIGPEADDEEQ